MSWNAIDCVVNKWRLQGHVAWEVFFNRFSDYKDGQINLSSTSVCLKNY